MPGPWALLSGWWLVDNGNNVPALEFAGLVKRFGDNVAVDHIDLAVPAGSFFGLVGPNGAGKTTSLSMAVGLLRPDGGTVKIFGRDVWADPVAAKALIGVLPDGGSVIFSSHVMALVERLCDHVAVIAKGKVVASGPLDEVRGGQSLDDAFVHIVGARTNGAEGRAADGLFQAAADPAAEAGLRHAGRRVREHLPGVQLDRVRRADRARCPDGRGGRADRRRRGAARPGA